MNGSGGRALVGCVDSLAATWIDNPWIVAGMRFGSPVIDVRLLIEDALTFTLGPAFRLSVSCVGGGV